MCIEIGGNKYPRSLFKRLHGYKPERLAWFRGKIWYIHHTQVENSDRISLTDIKDRSTGHNALKTDVRELHGEEWERQMEAILYFRRLGACE